MHNGRFPLKPFILRIRTDITLRYSDDDQTDFLDVQGIAIQILINRIAAMLAISAQRRCVPCKRADSLFKFCYGLMKWLKCIQALQITSPGCCG